jgi:hypothetical protein
MEAFMPKEARNLGETYRKASVDSFVAVVTSLHEANRGLAQGIASELSEYSKRSVGRAIEIQSQFLKQASDAYFSEVSRFARMVVGGYDTFMSQAEKLPAAHTPTPGGRRVAAQRAATSRKTGAAKRRSKSVKPKSRSKSARDKR